VLVGPTCQLCGTNQESGLSEQSRSASDKIWADDWNANGQHPFRHNPQDGLWAIGGPVAKRVRRSIIESQGTETALRNRALGAYCLDED